jgi:hypothetical protein
MTEYQKIKHILGTVFNAENDQSREESIALYRRTYGTPGQVETVKSELIAAFSDQRISWRSFLQNEQYEVMDFDSESEARSYALELLWNSLFKTPLECLK